MDAGDLRYFAYGSNMSATQMADRCPGAADPVRAVLADHAWLCNDRGVATVVPVPGRQVHGLVWRVTADHVAALDGYEGVAAGHYRREVVTVASETGAAVSAIVYVATSADPGPPRPGYLDRVIGGAVEHGLPDRWVTELRRWHGAERAAERAAVRRPGGLADLLAVDGVVESSTLGSRFGFLAVHGGELEVMTDTVARAAATDAGASWYTVHHPDEDVGHLPSTRFDPDESPTLARFLDHVDVVISVHGYGRPGRWTDVMAGGRNRDLARAVADRVHATVDGYRVVTDLDAIPPGLRGQHADNPVNRPPAAGVQLELPPRLRGLSPLSPPPGDDGLTDPTRRLIEALAAIARSW